MEIQYLNRGAMCLNFMEASLITVDFPQDELFISKISKKKFEIFSSKLGVSEWGRGGVNPHMIGTTKRIFLSAFRNCFI